MVKFLLRKKIALYFSTFNYSIFTAPYQGALNFYFALSSTDSVPGLAKLRLEFVLLTSKSQDLIMLWFSVPDFNSNDYKPRTRKQGSVV